MQTSLSLPAQPGWLGAFRAFIARGNVIDLGDRHHHRRRFHRRRQQSGQEHYQPADRRGDRWVDLSKCLHRAERPALSLGSAQKARAPTVNVGLLINALINLLIIAFVAFWIGKAAARLTRREAEAPSVPPAPSRLEVLLAEIRDLPASRTIHAPNPIGSDK